MADDGEEQDAMAFAYGRPMEGYSDYIDENEAERYGTFQEQAYYDAGLMYKKRTKPKVKKQATLAGNNEGTTNLAGDPPQQEGSEDEGSSDSDDSGYNSDTSSSSFSGSDDETNTDSGMLRLPGEMAFFGSQYYWVNRFAPITDQLKDNTISLKDK